MKKRLPFVLKTAFLIAFVLVQFCAFAGKEKREYYSLTVYHFATAQQQQLIEQYLQNAYLPALHKMGYTKLGVFTSWANDTSADKRIYVFQTISSLQELATQQEKLDADAAYQSAGEAYINAPYTSPAFSRKENIVLYAFPLAPKMQVPQLKSPNSERVYELRSYESTSEKIFANKVKMFNDGDEVGLFKRLNFNAAFYSSVIAGSKMPNLMYMTCFENMADRDAHWKTFGDDAYWKTLSAKPEYQHNVSKNDMVFLRPTAYSDF
ncbi:NIPSNAP family protein [Limnovirga soli]|uniref:NIPSNAP family containing protein n=1 Tax=Limnovirga soli TaxID=2656915 RepID=A0A8J8FD51_9BACT|nr:NIPSNAP family protein [Limnovirga soli]NNV55813.1 NIPSNAP family containing protein [Limnovirga soli]